MCKKVNFIAQTEVSLARGSQAKEWIFLTEASSQQVAFVTIIAAIHVTFVQLGGLY